MKHLGVVWPLRAPGIEGQVQLGIIGIKVITHAVPSINIPEWRSVQQVHEVYSIRDS